VYASRTAWMITPHWKTSEQQVIMMALVDAYGTNALLVVVHRCPRNMEVANGLFLPPPAGLPVQ